MDERTQKRLLIIVAVSIALIFLIRWGLTRTYTTLNEVAAAKKQAEKPAVTQQVPTPPSESETTETPATPDPAMEPQPDASSGSATE